MNGRTAIVLLVGVFLVSGCETANERYVNYRYTGRALFTDVVGFYKRYMPVEGWRLQQDVGTGGRQTLHFKKSGLGPVTADTPTCIITVFGRGEYANAIRFQRMEKQGSP